MLFQAVYLISLLVTATASPLEQRALAPTVTLANGNKVVGTVIGVLNQLPTATGQVSAYLALPFAASPTRFAPPKPTSFATKTATKLGPACLQQYPPGVTGSKIRSYFENPFGPTPLPEAEDCLHLNVFVPPNTAPNSGKTVMVWLYGGNLASGANSLNIYNGSSLAVTNDVIIVVPNYRTNFFGFSASPEIAAGQQNSGFLDQRFALDWVQTNIGAFGGDRNKVTLFGESSGAFSIKQLLAQPPTPRPFRAAVIESSGYSAGDGPDCWNKVVARFCSSKPTSQSNLDCLRNVRATDIQAFVSDPANNATFSPVPDQTYTTSSTLVQLRSGKYADVPLLVGSNLKEATIFAELAGLNDQSNLASAVKQVSGIDLGDLAGDAQGLFPDLSGFQLISKVLTDLVYTCPAALFATAVATNNSSPVWRYRFDGDFPNVRYFPGIGAYHTSEIPEVFGTYPVNTKYGSVTSDQRGLSRYMQGAWATFAKNPTTGPQPGYWNEFIKPFASNKIGVLGGKNNTAGLDLQPALWTDYPCYVYAPLLIALGNAF